MAVYAAAKFVQQCDQAKENGVLNLSDCGLAKVPTALYLLMSNTQLHSFDLSNNDLTRLPSQVGSKFTALRELLLSSNQLSDLPVELEAISGLQRLDISNNKFESLPHVVYTLQNLKYLIAKNNKISQIDPSLLSHMPNLEEVNLQGSMLTAELVQSLQAIPHMRIIL